MDLYIVADYGPADVAYTEVSQAMLEVFKDIDRVFIINVSAFDSYAAGLAVSQILKRANRGDLIFQNVAPRKDDLKERYQNKGEVPVLALTKEGVYIFGPASDGAFSFLGDSITHFFEVSLPASSSQFRSRDIFPVAFKKAIDKKGIEQVRLPDSVPEGIVIATDGYGNIKTSWMNPEVGSEVNVCIGDTKALALVRDSVFAAPEGYLVLAPGSSGSGFWELFLRGGSAAELFDFPVSGSLVEFE